jgi:hypothetical protein
MLRLAWPNHDHADRFGLLDSLEHVTLNAIILDPSEEYGLAKTSGTNEIAVVTVAMMHSLSLGASFQ